MKKIKSNQLLILGVIVLSVLLILWISYILFVNI